MPRSVWEKNGRNLSYAGTSGGFTKIGNYVGRIKALTSVIDALPDEDDTEYNFTNLVVLAKFSGEEEFANDVYQGRDCRSDHRQHIQPRRIFGEGLFRRDIQRKTEDADAVSA